MPADRNHDITMAGMMTGSQWADVVKAMPDVVKTLGLVVSALWVAWTFQKLERARSAQLKNRETALGIRRSRLDQQIARNQLLSQQPNIDIDIDVHQHEDYLAADHAIVIVAVTLKNTGTQNLDLVFPQSTVAIARIDLHADQRLVETHRLAPWWLDEDSVALETMIGRRFRVGQQRRMVFIARCQRPAVYLIQFYATYSRVEFDGEEPAVDAQEILAIEQASCVVPPLTRKKVARAASRSSAHRGLL